MDAWPGKGGGGGGGMNPAFWPGSGGAGGGGGKPGVGTGTVMVTTLSLASSRSLDSFSICKEDSKVTKWIYLVNLPVLLATISTDLHHFGVYINSIQYINWLLEHQHM